MAVARDTLGDLLHRWAMWVAAGNRAALGYAMCGYAERIGTIWSTDNTPPPVDTAIMRVDDCIKRLPQQHRSVVWAHYILPGTAKSKQARMNMGRDRYYELLDHGRTFVAHMLDEEATPTG